MEYILKVSPKGQITLPKKLRDALEIEDLVEIKLENRKGVVKKPTTEDIAGCFKKYASKKKTPIEKAIKKATDMVAHEIARKDN
ncbi:MAG: AbrB/MazE/SpoVT family DNA-binding domain-containing protein [Candidatus Brocadia sp.]|nr:AbrB/MazE/SpoVT family DNA-binding domain-containing protein [Candidatus Brocadia sp.]